MKFAVIDPRWFPLANYRLDVGFWINVTEILRRSGVDPTTATEEQVKKAIARIQG